MQRSSLNVLSNFLMAKKGSRFQKRTNKRQEHSENRKSETKKKPPKKQETRQREQRSSQTQKDAHRERQNSYPEGCYPNTILLRTTRDAIPLCMSASVEAPA